MASKSHGYNNTGRDLFCESFIFRDSSDASRFITTVIIHGLQFNNYMEFGNYSKQKTRYLYIAHENVQDSEPVIIPHKVINIQFITLWKISLKMVLRHHICLAVIFVLLIIP